MSVPENQSGSYVSSILFAAHFLPPDDVDTGLLVAKELGGVALNDPTEGLRVQEWTLRYLKGSKEFSISAPNTPDTVVHTATGDVSEIDLAFDQNMNPFIAYVEDGDAKYYWWDTAADEYAVTLLPAGSLTPRCCIDDKRDFAAGSQVSDVILCYVDAGGLYKRWERDRYSVTYTVDNPFLHPVYELPATLKRVGMNKVNRLQWLCDLADPIDWCNYVGKSS